MANRWIAELPLRFRDLIPTDLPPLRPAAPEEAVAAVSAGENGEPLVEVGEPLGLYHCYEELNLETLPPKALLRQGVVDRLARAQGQLPDRLGIVVLDGWRTRAFQAELLDYYHKLSGVDLGLYVSDPDSATLMAPHVTGGAVDLTLSVDGVPYAMGTDFDSFDEAANLMALEDVPDDGDPRAVLDRDLRRLLAQVLVAAGLSPYPLEWWHWSYGEQRWGAFVGEQKTVYSPLPTMPA